jgi:hypothetical protein
LLDDVLAQQEKSPKEIQAVLLPRLIVAEPEERESSLLWLQKDL